MRIGQLAAAAGVTVRTVRHYHAVGLLDEPPRTAGGYRVYDVADLVRLLRIRALVEAGIPLGRAAALVGDEADPVDDPLAAIDADLTARIDRLTERRDLLRRLRASGRGSADAGMPPDLAEHLLAMADPSVPDAWRAADGDLAVLLHRMLAGAGDDAVAAELYAWIAAPERSRRVRGIAQRASGLGDDATPDEVSSIVDEIREVMAEWEGVVPRMSGLDAELLAALAARAATTHGQREALRRLMHDPTPG